ncbi:hypothetical protein DVW87_03270 [Sphingomonas aracearum]|uniref:Uncharacterized protein n=1 Tax=Sphingomonas aracearum TaxID=2283317 RepID=A0A369W3U5_9SPHN|nr:hypothetical protein DVW87_03270 [Sphingomonas aracearum]
MPAQRASGEEPRRRVPAGPGVVAFAGPQGAGCVPILGNDAWVERAFPLPVRTVPATAEDRRNGKHGYLAVLISVIAAQLQIRH